MSEARSSAVRADRLRPHTGFSAVNEYTNTFHEVLLTSYRCTNIFHVVMQFSVTFYTIFGDMTIPQRAP